MMWYRLKRERYGDQMKGHIQNEHGFITIENDVLAKYTGTAAIECFGVVGMASVGMRDGIVKLLMKDNVKHGVSIVVTGDRIRVDLHIIVAYGVSIMAVSENLIHNVQYKLEEFTGMTVERINVFVEGVKVVD